MSCNYPGLGLCSEGMHETVNYRYIHPYIGHYVKQYTIIYKDRQL